MPEAKKRSEGPPRPAYGLSKVGSVRRLEIRLAGEKAGEVIQYAHLVRLSWHKEHQLTLVCSDCLITIEGEGLGPLLRKKLACEEVEFLQEGGTGPEETAIHTITVSHAATGREGQ